MRAAVAMHCALRSRSMRAQRSVSVARARLRRGVDALSDPDRIARRFVRLVPIARPCFLWCRLRISHRLEKRTVECSRAIQAGIH
ncbi:hypothetical protein [Burkholderia multivorans]|uniref:hypothetical protein n=1 Tax=Burkholderia multivorans TaxID=87883 RepID=UPI00015FD99F|nr:hypothetical protein [Burkholderia multivorans]ABX17837.1 hypothetical protein Bmul_4156 [Burkholderia multivorans ATCC 17616]EJO62674.1 hypothetical protein BURMUCF2_A0730 [Burkholderia multivorans CF2]KVQ83873.1 hypothetical protein WK07_07635 [Burkholderia multivorans]KWH16141.1 hypothetical protein WL98_28985 [Burkholderia multivorans]MBU9441690.1 hypothetical protein [Burkholderia multivorans]